MKTRLHGIKGSLPKRKNQGHYFLDGEGVSVRTAPRQIVVIQAPHSSSEIPGERREIRLGFTDSKERIEVESSIPNLDELIGDLEEARNWQLGDSHETSSSTSST